MIRIPLEPSDLDDLAEYSRELASAIDAGEEEPLVELKAVCDNPAFQAVMAYCLATRDDDEEK